MKVNHQQGVKLDTSDQNFEFNFRENNNYHQIADAYLQNQITIGANDNTDFTIIDTIRLVKNAFAYCEISLSTIFTTQL